MCIYILMLTKNEKRIDTKATLQKRIRKNKKRKVSKGYCLLLSNNFRCNYGILIGRC